LLVIDRANDVVCDGEVGVADEVDDFRTAEAAESDDGGVADGFGFL